MTMAYSPIARTLVIAEDAGSRRRYHARSLCPATISQWSKGRAFFPGPDRGARAPERCGRKSEAGVDLHDRAFGQGARRSDREIGEPLGRPNAKSSQSQDSADSITFIDIRHDGPDFCALHRLEAIVSLPAPHAVSPILVRSAPSLSAQGALREQVFQEPRLAGPTTSAPRVRA
jgi:hypothetical protein